MTPSNDIPRRLPVIRVFVSSTFSDLKLERNALQDQVFPKLEKRCEQDGFQFQAIDLRWGISIEAGLDHRAMKICFDELRRSQEISPEPNFLILLGNRYGWRPLPEEISQSEFDKLVAAAESGGGNKTTVAGAHGKTALQVLLDWYRCDDNVVLPDDPETSPDYEPLNYILQSRNRNLGDGRDFTHFKNDPTKDTQDWMDVQQILWSIINAAFPAERLDHRFDNIDWQQNVAEVNDPKHPKRAVPQMVRFQGSATEQEIWCGALAAPNAERHVIVCFRELANLDGFAPGEVKDFFDLTGGKFDEALSKRQSDLKDAIRKRLKNNTPIPILFSRLRREKDKVVVDASEADIRKFCDDVETKLWAIIKRQIEEYWAKTEKGTSERAARELKIEQDEHDRFGRERGNPESFVGRKDELKKIRDYLLNNSRWPLVVYGASGSGKTALMWRAAEQYKTEFKNKNPEVIVRLIGITPHSSDIRSLLNSLCQELRVKHPLEKELPTDIRELTAELQEHFRSTKPAQPLIVFLDALDQLSDADNGRQLNWIPVGELPDNVKLVVSCLSDRPKDDRAGQPYAELSHRQLIANHSINLDALSGDDAAKLMFETWLPQAGHKVNNQQRESILENVKFRECCQPIYLKLLFEEARLWRSYDELPDLGKDVFALLDQFFKRLEQRENHGPLLVKLVLGYLGASRYGLAENEILEILFADPDYKSELSKATEKTQHALPSNAKRIPIAIWSRLRFDLAPYLTEQAAPGANVLTFYHRQVDEWVQEHFVKSSEHTWQPHRRLADYFQIQPKGSRQLDELPWLLELLKDWGWLKDFLVDLDSFKLMFSDERLKWELQSYWIAVESNYNPGLEYYVVVETYSKLHSKRETAELQHKLGEFFIMRGEDSLAIKFLEPAYNTRISVLEEKDPATLESGNRLALAKEHLGQLAQAEKLYQRLLEVSKEVWGNDNPNTLQALHDLGGIYYAEGENNKAIPLLEEALIGRRKLFGEAADSTILTRLDLGLCYLSLSDPRAENFLTELMEFEERVKGKDYVWLESVLSALGNYYATNGDLEKAEPMFRRALTISEAKFGPYNRLTLLKYQNLGTCLMEMGQTINGKSLWLEAYNRSKKSTGNLIQFQVNTFRAKIINFLIKEGSFQQAAPLVIDDVTEIGRLMEHKDDKEYWFVSPTRPEGPDPIECFTNALQVSNQLLESDTSLAESVLFSCIPILQLGFGESGEYISSAYNLLGIIMKRRGALIEAEDYYRRSFKALFNFPDMEKDRQAALNNLLWVQRNRLESNMQVGLKKIGDLKLKNKILAGDGAILSLSYSEECQQLISGGQDSRLKLWRKDSLDIIHNFNGHNAPISGVSFAAAGRVAISGSWDRTVRQWDIVKLSPLPYVQKCPSDVCGISANSDGISRIVFALENGLMGIWEEPFKEGAKVLGNHKDTATSTAITSDGLKAVSGSADEFVRAWDLRTCNYLSMMGHRDSILTVGISFDGQFGYSGGKDGQIFVWDLNSYELIHILRGHKDCISALASSRDFQWIASGSWDNTVRIWNAKTGTCAAIFEIGEQVWALAANPHFDAIFVGDKAGYIHQLQFVR